MTSNDTAEPASGQAEIAVVLRAYDALVEALEKHRIRLESIRALPGFDGPLREAEQRLQALQVASHADDPSWDYRYMYRIERGIAWSRAATETLETDVLDRISELRHNARQLDVASEGKMV